MRHEVETICIETGPRLEHVQAAVDAFLRNYPRTWPEIDDDGYRWSGEWTYVLDFPNGAVVDDPRAFEREAMAYLRSSLRVRVERAIDLKFAR
ncbi:hypothetical protein [Tsukamurella hominis]|uniref:hypothetical protein n=1 Tax=Tsukamurella hominis TaxID=1970232 RepID=UPI0039E869E1